MGRPRRRGRDIHGVLLLDKPQGLTSNDALQKVKRLFNANKAGHTGALDPLATGMLPICLGEATKFSQFLLDADKRYRVTALLGQRTTTSDAEGEVISERPVSFNQAQLQAALEHFQGSLMQVPSMYSALKYQGRPLYEYARQGIEVPREARQITLYETILLRQDERALELEVHCSKGTYIRTLVDDMGEMLGCGAHVIQLRRLQVADYPADAMVTLEQLNTLVESAHQESFPLELVLDPLLLPTDTALQSLPEVNLLPVVASYLKQGQAVQVSGAPREGMVRLSEGESRHFIGVGVIDEQGNVAPRRLVSIPA
ncbi:MAG: tRNA pseudouridine(55) synthase TruB [Enterobacteriaceae bacterium]